jgi:hypothetical protein
MLVFAVGALAVSLYAGPLVSEPASAPPAGISAALSGKTPTAAFVQVGTPNDDEGNPMPAIPPRALPGAESPVAFGATGGIEVVGTRNDDEGNPMPPAPARFTQFAAAGPEHDYRLERESCCYGSDRAARVIALSVAPAKK